MFLILLEYLWDVFASLTFIIYPLLVYKRFLKRKRLVIFLVLCLIFIERQLSNTVYYALVWQFNHWLVYEMKMIKEPYAIGIYIIYRSTQFIITSYGGYVVYGFYLLGISILIYYGFLHRERLKESMREWNLSDIKNRLVTFLIGKLMSTGKEETNLVI